MALGRCRARDGAMGNVAVIVRDVLWPRARACASLLVALGVSGCGVPPELLGIGAGGATGAATANPYIAIATAIVVEALASEIQDSINRNVQTTRQRAIASAAAPLAKGEQATWSAVHFADIGNTQGVVQVTRVLQTPLTSCKEIVFRLDVASHATRGPFLATICQTGDAWQWAGALPAVDRWGALQ